MTLAVAVEDAVTLDVTVCELVRVLLGVPVPLPVPLSVPVPVGLTGLRLGLEVSVGL